MDKAGKKFWNDLWASSELPKAVDPSGTQLKNWVNRRFHRFFHNLFDKSHTSSMRLLEIGCGKSAWLPYFSKEFGFQVCGLDYSKIGCQMARQVLKNSGVKGEVVYCDFFSPPEDMLGAFDVVVSFGVVEHFEDTDSCLGAASMLLKPGGMLITNIPNLVGWIGFLQKAVNRPLYDMHQLIDPAKLREGHERAGLEVVACDYFLCTHFGVCGLHGIPANTGAGFLKKVLVALLSRASILVALIEDKFGEFPAHRVASPYINCIARKR